MLTTWRKLKQNPIYLREKGSWGEPNPFFATLNRYSPLLILLALILALCGACQNNSTLLGFNDEAWVIFAFLVCLPNLGLLALTWAGNILVPVLTAPAVSEERKRGTWEMLRLTPQPMLDILLAKMFGSLARLKIWWPLFICSLLQAAAAALAILAAPLTNQSDITTALWTLLMTIGLLLRPWAEIAFAAITGTVISTWVSSGRLALVFTYSVIIFVKLINSSLLWFALIYGILDLNNDLDVAPPALSALGPTLTYIAAVALLSLLLVWRADRVHTWGDDATR